MFDLFRVRDGKMAAHWDDTPIRGDAQFLRKPISRLSFPKAKRPIY